jgi:hypothetical protein
MGHQQPVPAGVGGEVNREGGDDHDNAADTADTDEIVG